MTRAASILMLVENASVPFDGRVWKESLTLRDAGYAVTVISPRGAQLDREAHELREGIPIYRFEPASRGGYPGEYGTAFVRMRRLIRQLGAGQPFDVVHAANPPDFLLLTALSQRRRGARFVFDHHDLSPELYLTRFGRRRDPLYGATALLERLAFRLADVVVSTNASYRQVAVARGAKAPEDVFVVRNGPDLSQFVLAEPDESLKRGLPYLLAWVGVMAPQDGIDYALHALAELAAMRDDWRALIVGDGAVRREMEELCRTLGIAERVDFTGHVSQERVREILSTADVCLSPDPKTPLSDLSTMIKVVEYMALARPIVSFELRETHETARDAAVYASGNSSLEFARRIDELLDDPEMRARMGAVGRARVAAGLDWSHSQHGLLAAYDRLFELRPRRD